MDMETFSFHKIVLYGKLREFANMANFYQFQPVANCLSFDCIEWKANEFYYGGKIWILTLYMRDNYIPVKNDHV